MSDDKEVQDMKVDAKVEDEDSNNNNNDNYNASKEESVSTESQQDDNYISESDNLEKMILSTGTGVVHRCRDKIHDTIYCSG